VPSSVSVELGVHIGDIDHIAALKPPPEKLRFSLCEIPHIVRSMGINLARETMMSGLPIEQKDSRPHLQPVPRHLPTRLLLANETVRLTRRLPGRFTIAGHPRAVTREQQVQASLRGSVLEQNHA